MLSDWRQRRAWMRYTAAALFVALAAVVRVGFLRNVGAHFPFVTFYPAVIIASLYGGVLAGGLATALSAIYFLFWIEPVRQPFWIHDPSSWLGLAAFLVSCALIAWITEAMHRAQARVGRAEAEAELSLERERAAEKISRMSERLRLASEAANSGAWEWDLRTNENVWSEELWKVYRLEPDSCRPSYATWVQLVHPDDREAVERAVQKAVQNGADLRLEFRVGDGNNQERWAMMRGRPARDAGGQVVQYLGIAMDITEKKRSEEALRVSEDRFRRAIENIPDVVVIYDRDRRIQFINTATTRITGRPVSDFIGRREEELFPPEVCEKFLPTLIASYNTRIAKSVDVDLEMPGVGLRKLAITCVPLLDERGEVREVVGITHDDTERKHKEDQILSLAAELEERVRQRTAQLEAVNKELESFAYSVSHDLRAPLRGIDGWSLALLEDYGNSFDERAHGYLGRVRSETQRMGTLIDDLLQLSRVTRLEMKFKSVDLTSLAQTIASRLREVNPERGMDFSVEPGLTVSGDTRLLEIALTNLLDNSVKFTRPRARAVIEFLQVEDGDEPAFCVRDNGVGFDMAYAGTLFGAFQRLHKASEFPGTGIGLATANRVIRRHGGRMWAEAQPDRGASFYFTLRAAK